MGPKRNQLNQRREGVWPGSKGTVHLQKQIHEKGTFPF